MKKLIPAIVLLLISAMIMATASYAWFSMNTQVTATGMQVKAKAESGLLISELSATNATWDNSATGGTSSPYSMIPTSTVNGTAWFHANSKGTGSSASATSSANSTDLVSAYESLTGLASSTKIAVDSTNCAVDYKYKEVDGTDGYQDSIDQGVYVKYTFFLKSSAGEIQCNHVNPGDQYVQITSITVNGLNGSKALDAALRVGVQFGTGDFYVYAPIANSTPSYYVGTDHDLVNTETVDTSSSKLSADGTVVYKTTSDLDILPAFTAAGTPVYVFIWIEGEDANCISNNIKATLDNLSISVNFDLVTVTAAP